MDDDRRSLAALERFIEDASRRGSTSPLFAPTAMSLANSVASCAAATSLGMFASVTESAVLHATRVGTNEAVLAAICAGNHKDEAGGIAAAICARSLVRAFARGCDERSVERVLVDALDDAHRSLAGFEPTAMPSRALWTAMGKRKDLRALGALVTAVVCTRESLWIAHIGDGIAVLVEGGAERSLTMAHTLQNLVAPEVPEAARGVLQHVVVRALGLTAEHKRPEVDVARVSVKPTMRVILGAASLRCEFDEHGTVGAQVARSPTAIACVERLLAGLRPGVAVSCVAIDVR